MANTKITAESFLDSKELREQTMDKIEVLEKVKQLFLIPELECMTVKQVADYFEVDSDTIKKQYQRNQEEFDSDGTCIKTLGDFKSLSGTRCPTLKMAQRRGFLEITLSDDTTLSIPNCGIKCYPKRAILRMGMLLQDSRIAREIRGQLLNTFEHTTEEQRVTSINEEENLVGNIVRATLNSDMTTAIASLTEYIGYKNRYIAEIKQYNTELVQKNESLNSEVSGLQEEVAAKNTIITETKPKVEFYDAVADTNHLIDVGQFAKILFDKSGISLGRNRLYEWLRRHYYIRSNNEPYQQYVEAGYFVGKMVWIQIGEHYEPKPKTFITGKGQQFILKKLKEEYAMGEL